MQNVYRHFLTVGRVRLVRTRVFVTRILVVTHPGTIVAPADV